MNSSNVYNCDQPNGIFYLDAFMEWLRHYYSEYINGVMENIAWNAICYILEFGDDSHYIDDIACLFDREVDPLPFFCDKYLSEQGREVKRMFWEQNHPSWWDKKVDDADYWFSFV